MFKAIRSPRTGGFPGLCCVNEMSRYNHSSAVRNHLPLLSHEHESAAAFLQLRLQA